LPTASSPGPGLPAAELAVAANSSIADNMNNRIVIRILFS